jgi:toxin CcdB
MTQFDVFVNPIPAARGAYPFVVAMQSDFARQATDQIVAPLAPSTSMSKVAGRLTPAVVVNGTDHAVLVPRLTAMRTADLSRRVGSIAGARGELLAAIDYLFFGV